MKQRSSHRARRVNVRSPRGVAKALPAPRERFWLFAIILVTATILVYRPAWSGGFIWDDDAYITKNPLLTAPDGLWRIWFSLESPSQYFPLTYTTFRVERALWDLNPTGYHWINILLHATNALLLWRLLTRLKIPGAWLAAGIFALHPVQVESVAWITERKNVLMGFFFLLTLLAWTRFIDERERRPWRFYRLALIFYVLALSAKSTACTLPAALFLILWLQKKRIDWPRVWQIAPFVVLGLTMGLIAVWWERYHVGTRGAMFALGPLERLIVATRAAWFYLGKLFWPAKLTFIYPQWTITSSNPLAYIWLVAGIALCAAIYFARRHVGRSVEVAAAFFVATLSPVLGFIMLYTFRYTFVADHYQYLACIGPIALVSAGLVKLTQSPQFGSRFLFSLEILMLGALGILTWRQSASYGDIETLWRTTIDRNPGCWMAEHNLGGKLLEKRDLDGAIAHFERAVQLRYDNAESHYGMADALRRKGDVERAMTEAQISLDLRPDDSETHVVLGMALMTKGQLDEAATHFSKAIEIRPNYSAAHYNLAIALLDKHETGKAIEHYQKAIELQPDFLEALTNLAWIFANYPDTTVRNAPKALELAQRANQLTADTDPNVLRTLAAAYATNKSFDKALETSRRALQFAQEQRNLEVAEAIRREMSFYERGQPPYRAD
jgi:tetratricopeptide (TPR) repeat protein